MKIVVSPDSFKESLTAQQICGIIEEEIVRLRPDVIVKKVPLADGGEGTSVILTEALQGEFMYANVRGPLGETVQAKYGFVQEQKLAIIEVAEACGLHLISPGRRNPLEASTFGVGELILHAVHNGAAQLIICLGGSGTNDGGVGMLQALGANILDDRHKQVGLGAKYLSAIQSVDLSTLDSRLKTCSIMVACDVKNPLCGENGASKVFGPQKGATEEMVAQLDKGLYHFAQVVERDCNLQLLGIEGGGAAGGLGAALHLLGASMKPGIRLVMEKVCYAEQISDADLIITGEGRLDSQTAQGKVIAGVLAESEKLHKPVIALCGKIENGYEVLFKQGLTAAFSICNGPQSLPEALGKAEENLRVTVQNVIKLYISNL
ncbi:MAG: glycerate kinase [Ectobacillus sp.]